MSGSGGGHEGWEDRLSEYVDGGLEPAEREALAKHVSSCVACRSALSDIEAIRASARGLSEIEPPTDLWPAIEREVVGATRGGDARVGRRGAVTRGRPVRPSAGAVLRRRRGVFLTIPELAAAAVVTIALSASVSWAASQRLTTGDPASLDEPAARTGDAVSSTDPAVATVEREVDALTEELEDATPRLDPRVLRALERTLGSLDRSISEASAALEARPENDFLRAHLERSYSRKAAYLRQALAVEAWSADG